LRTRSPATAPRRSSRRIAEAISFGRRGLARPSLASLHGRYGRRDPRGGIGTSHDELAAAVSEVERKLAEGAGDGVSALELLDSLDIPPGAREAIVERVEISSASSAARVAAADLAGLAHIDDEPSPSIAGGNQRLALVLAAELGDAVRLDSPVDAIAWSAEGVRASVGGGEVGADVAVIAVPASVLDRIAFEPRLPDAVSGALALVEYGDAAKLFVPLTEPAPTSAVMSVPDRFWTWTATGDSDRVQPVVSAFAGSRAALDALDVDAGPDRWLDSLERLRGDLALDRAGAVLSTWHDDPWCAPPTPPRLRPRWPRPWSPPIGPLAFAGEHTGGRYAALMEGAVRSGRRAARSLLPR
jgi:monoamine oxidase